MSQDQEHKKTLRDQINEIEVKTNRVYEVVLKGDKLQGVYSLVERQQADEEFQRMMFEEFRDLKKIIIDKNDEVKKEVKDDRKISDEKLAELIVHHDRQKRGALKAGSWKTLTYFLFILCLILCMLIYGPFEVLDKLSMKYLGI